MCDWFYSVRYATTTTVVLKSRGFVILIRYITQGLILAKNRNYPYQNEDYYRKFNPSEITTLKEHKHCTLVCDE